ncbi:outer membrane beta-barrel protein [Desertivirga arenae]|uniref:type IX secretion/gliding motility protein PorT/SprT n=1 Tax=Desertivirga arenae TaxID=2810309 RepID=UPI001A96CF20|nr:outer membrane beta-barrel protein [Pedobacter sp. SYSU D00823]
MTKSRSFLLLFLFFSVISKAQNNGGGVDDEPLHFGFTFQYINAEYKIYKKPDWYTLYTSPDNQQPIPVGTDERLMSITSPKTPGFGLGFVSDLKVGSHANLRFTPLLVFTDRMLNYQYRNPENFQQKKIQSTLVDFPLGIKLKSDKRGNFRAYILGGAKYSMDIISKKKIDDTELSDINKLVKNKTSFLSWETGIGFDLYFEYFKMSPEIKFSQSMGNVLKNDEKPNAYTKPLDKLFLRSFQFSLYFE